MGTIKTILFDSDASFKPIYYTMFARILPNIYE